MRTPTHFASLSSGYLHILHVVPANSSAEEADVARALDFLESTYGATGTILHGVAVRHGNEAKEDEFKFAEAQNVELIVMGARGMGRLSRVVSTGSVADKVMQSANVPGPARAQVRV